MENLQKTLNQLKIQDFIWIIYLFLATFALLSNQLERDYLIHHNKESRKKFREINITIFIVTFIIYLYFFLHAREELHDAMLSSSKDKIFLQQLFLIGSILFLVGGAIYLYVEVQSNNIEEAEIALV